MAWAFRCVVAAAGVLLSCAGSLSDPPLATDDSARDDSPATDSRDSADIAAGSDQAETSAAPKHDPTGAAVVATLRTRDSELTILSAGGSMRYALVDAAGDERTLTLDELRTYDQNLFEVVTAAMARSIPGSSLPQPAGSSTASPRAGAVIKRRPGGAFIDASLDRSTRPSAGASPGDIRAERGTLGLPRAGIPPRD